MGLFGFGSKGKSGGTLNVIRCDEHEFLVWKWRPGGQGVNSTTRENAIRYGSTLHVKEGEVAVFEYNQNNGTQMDFIPGPYDGTIETANFPVLSSLVGAAFGGESPFRASVYFINQAYKTPLRFAVPWFDVYENSSVTSGDVETNLNFGIPVAVRGTVWFRVNKPELYIRMNRLRNFTLDDLRMDVKSTLQRYIKKFITTAPVRYNISVLKLETKIDELSDKLQDQLDEVLTQDFGLQLVRLDISAIELDKESEGYETLMEATRANELKLRKAKTDIDVQKLSNNEEDRKEEMRYSREERHAQMHMFDRNADVMKAFAEHLTSGGASSPADMMTSMAMGTVMAQQMGGMMAGMKQGGMAAGMNVAPPPPVTSSYMVSVNGTQSGPFSIRQLQQFAQQGEFTPQTYVWKQGMANWEFAGNVAELAPIFAGETMPPPPPPMP